jgi:hypothetical protein
MPEFGSQPPLQMPVIGSQPSHQHSPVAESQQYPIESQIGPPQMPVTGSQGSGVGVGDGEGDGRGAGVEPWSKTNVTLDVVVGCSGTTP